MKKTLIILMLVIPIGSYSGINKTLPSLGYPLQKNLHGEVESHLNYFLDGDKVIHAIEKDTTELLTRSGWIHKKRDDRTYDSSFVRKFYFMKGDKFKIEINKGEPNGTWLGTWRREGSMIYTLLDGSAAEHEAEIIEISENTLVLHLHGRDAIDVLAKD